MSSGIALGSSTKLSLELDRDSSTGNGNGNGQLSEPHFCTASASSGLSLSSYSVLLLGSSGRELRPSYVGHMMGNGQRAEEGFLWEMLLKQSS